MATTVRVYLDGGSTPAATAQMNLDRTFAVAVPGVADGVHSFEVTAQEDGKAESPRVIQSSITVAHGTTQHPLVGDATGTGALAGDLAAPGAPPTHPLAGDLVGTGAASADLTAPVNHPLAGSISGTGAAAADLTAPGAGGVAVSDLFPGPAGALDANYATITGMSAPAVAVAGGGFNVNLLGALRGARRVETFAANQYSECLCAPSPGGARGVGPVVRCSSSAQTFYAAVVAGDEFDSMIYAARVYKVAAGTWTQLGADFSLDGSTGIKILRLEASSTTLTLKVGNEGQHGSLSTLGTRTDASIASGFPGFASGDSSGGNVDNAYLGDL